MISRPKIIALVGAKRCGKDTVANMLSELGYENWKIAGKLKNICKEMFGFTDDEIETDLKDTVNARWGVSPRHVLQVLGTEVVQFQLKQYIPSITRTFWMERLYDDYIKNDKKMIVISDMRFQHECDFLRSKFGDQVLVVKIVRPSLNVTDKHVSEQEWQKIKEDKCILNNSSLEHLEAQVRILIK